MASQFDAMGDRNLVIAYCVSAEGDVLTCPNGGSLDATPTTPGEAVCEGRTIYTMEPGSMKFSVLLESWPKRGTELTLTARVDTPLEMEYDTDGDVDVVVEGEVGVDAADGDGNDLDVEREVEVEGETEDDGDDNDASWIWDSRSTRTAAIVRPSRLEQKCRAEVFSHGTVSVSLRLDGKTLDIIFLFNEEGGPDDTAADYVNIVYDTLIGPAARNDEEDMD